MPKMHYFSNKLIAKRWGLSAPSTP